MMLSSEPRPSRHSVRWRTVRFALRCGIWPIAMRQPATPDRASLPYFPSAARRRSGWRGIADFTTSTQHAERGTLDYGSPMYRVAHH